MTRDAWAMSDRDYSCSADDDAAAELARGQREAATRTRLMDMARAGRGSTAQRLAGDMLRAYTGAAWVQARAELRERVARREVAPDDASAADILLAYAGVPQCPQLDLLGGEG